MRLVAIQLIGLIMLHPLTTMPWNRAARRGRSLNPAVRVSNAPRWRLEIYSLDDDAAAAIEASAGVVTPLDVSRTTASDPESSLPAMSWTRPRVELDVDMMDPFTDESLTALLGPDHRVRFETGNEVVVDTSTSRLRIRRFRFG